MGKSVSFRFRGRSGTRNLPARGTGKRIIYKLSLSFPRRVWYNQTTEKKEEFHAANKTHDHQGRGPGDGDGKGFYHSDAVDHVVGDQVLHRTFLDAVGQEPSLWGLVLWDGGQAVGFSYLTSFYACECGGKTLMIEEIYLKESCRGKGFGRQFFRWLFQEYSQVKRFRLEVTKANAGAAKLYASLGFVPLEYNQMILDRE
ncbi:GNAT family N-acetyltransferase [[Clostridium] leptum]|uniref:GNAT family N-acetyltransferase n=1 Tax=[Clostridium] leptum TaxID=1535 RepID=A0A412AZ03_9FIRM|nr:GNAT family N-acetyltransferase [[Clostridium] leptum]